MELYCSKSLLLLVSLSSLLLSGNAVRILDVSPSYAPASAPNSEGTLNSPSKHVVNPDLAKICKEATDAVLCADTILPHIQGSVDPVKALFAEIEATKIQTKKTAGIIAELLADPSSSKDLVDTVDVCRENYDSIMDNLDQTVEAMSTLDYPTAATMLSGVIADQQTCEDTFRESPEVDFPFAGDSNTVLQLAANCLDILQLLRPN